MLIIKHQNHLVKWVGVHFPYNLTMHDGYVPLGSCGVINIVIGEREMCHWAISISILVITYPTHLMSTYVQNVRRVQIKV
jgi:hypothetical protein